MTVAGFVVRRAVVGDVEVVVAQRRAMFEEMRSTESAALDDMAARFAPWVKREIAAERYLGWFAVAEGIVAAGLGLWLMEWPPHVVGRASRRGYLLNVYTEKRYRRLGLARELVKVAVDWCRGNGVDVMVLHASDAGRRMYEELGFGATNEMRMVLSDAGEP
jgi:GNAT superfamily N-acetyltransferase